MYDGKLRAVKDTLMAPLADAIGRRFSPNALSVAAFAIGLACAASAYAGLAPLSLGLWLLNRVADGLDGLVARRSGRTSDRGAYLDIVLDFVVYAALPLSLALGDASRAPSAAALLAAFYVNGATWMYLSSLLEKRGRGAAASGQPTSVAMPAGIIEGTETIVFFSLILALPAYAAPLMYAFALLTVLGAALRFAQGFKALKVQGF
jgi:phosphatidylglycerophosphate synthase